MRRVLAAAVAAIGLTLSVPMVAAYATTAPRLAPAGGVGNTPRVTFGAAPSGPKGPDGRPYYTFSVNPGAKLTDHVAITNYTHKTLRLQVYTVDAEPATAGTISFPQASAPRKDAGSWIAVGTPHRGGVVVVKPRSIAVLPLHIRVPANASPGDHVAGVVASLTGLIAGKFGHSGLHHVKFDQRIALRASFRVSGATHPSLAIESLHASYSGLIDPFAKGKVKVAYRVVNAGNVVLGGPQTVTIHGLFGATVGSPPIVAVPPLLPGASYPVSVTVRNVYPELVESAKVTVKPEGTLGDPAPGIGTVSSSVHFLAIPWIILLVLLLLILGFALWYWRRRRRRRQPQGQGRHRADPADLGPVLQGETTA